MTSVTMFLFVSVLPEGYHRHFKDTIIFFAQISLGKGNIRKPLKYALSCRDVTFLEQKNIAAQGEIWLQPHPEYKHTLPFKIRGKSGTEA